MAFQKTASVEIASKIAAFFVRDQMKHLRIAISALMIIIAFNPLTAHAQTKARPKLQLLMEELSDESVKCGIRADAIKTSATLVLRRNGIDISNNPILPVLFIVVVSLPNSDAICTAHLYISIRDIDEGKKRYGFYKKNENVSLCEHSVITRSLRSDMSRYLSGYTEELLKSCLAEIDY